jgi:Holliday junction resolvase RusA-like endonuclease
VTVFGLETPVERREIADRAMVLELPVLPPSTNNLYMNIPGKGRMKTQKYRDWLHTSGLILRRQVTGTMRGRVDIVIKLEDCHPTRDADNTLKPCCDLLKAVGAITDDRSRFVRSVKAEWANVKGMVIEIERAA